MRYIVDISKPNDTSILSSPVFMSEHCCIESAVFSFNQKDDEYDNEHIKMIYEKNDSDEHRVILVKSKGFNFKAVQ